MFQTYINHFFQSFANEFTIAFMKLVSAFGTMPAYLAIIFILMFGWDLKKGIITIHIMLWVNLTNNFLKEFFHLPRPVDIDGSLTPFANDYNHIQLDTLNHSPDGFFKPIAPEIIDACNQSGIVSPGFPSGHVAGAAAIWPSLAWLTQKRWIGWFAIPFIILTMISRLFLGVHFFADVCGGLANGIFITILAYYLLKSSNWNLQGITIAFWNEKMAGKVIEYFFLLILPILLCFVPHVPIEMTAPLLAINLVILTTPLHALNELASLLKRAARVLIVMIMFIGLTFILKKIPQPRQSAFQFMIMVLQYYLTFRVSIAICLITGLYNKTNQE
jgi:membrane-associated phospholipid phosphatase